MRTGYNVSNADRDVCDEDVLLRAHDGDGAAYEMLAARHRAALPGSAATNPGTGDEAIADAFLSLPQRLQQALWWVDVKGRPLDDAAGLLGLSPAETTGLVDQARERLQAIYLENFVHLGETSACPDRRDLARYVPGRCTTAEESRMHEHGWG